MTALAPPMTATTPRRLHLDARTKLALLLLVNVFGLAPTALPVTLTCIAVVSALLACDRRFRYLAGYALVMAASLIASHILPSWLPGALAAGVGLGGFYFAKYGTVLAFGAYLVGSTAPPEIILAARRFHIPEAVIIPLAIVFRFLPAIATEVAAVSDAMKLRRPGGRWPNPARSAEYLIIPVISSTLRIGDDLTASALTRGLGCPGPKTSAARSQFGPGDVVGLAFGVAILVAVVATGGFA